MYEPSARIKVGRSKRENPLRERNVALRREGYKQEERAEIPGIGVRTIQGWEHLDRQRKCVKHVLTKKFIEENHRVNLEGGILSETIANIEIQQCRHCEYQERRRSFGQIFRKAPSG